MRYGDPLPLEAASDSLLMPIRDYLLVKQGKELGYWYRARSVEAIHICWKLEQDLVTRGDGIYDLQPGTTQESEDTRERFGASTLGIPR